MIELTHMQCIRLMAAGHALRMPSGCYGGVTHKQARAVVEGILGFCPKGAPAGPSMEDCLEWLGLRAA